MNVKYAIVANYYMYKEGDDDYTEPVYLGLEGEHKIFVFDEKVNERTKLFKTAKEAGEYVDKHFSPDKVRMSFKSVQIVEVEQKDGE